MTAVPVLCPFEDCSHFGKIEHVELNRYERHLAHDHDRNDLFEFAIQKGIIQDPLRSHNFSYIIKKIAQFSTIHGGLHNGGN